MNQLERFCRDRGTQFQSFEMGAQLQALCTITLWQEVTQDDDGKDMFTNWYVGKCIFCGFLWLKMIMHCHVVVKLRWTKDANVLYINVGLQIY